MPTIAPRIPPRLVAEIARADDPALPIAEVCRRVGAAAERLALPRPSYERVRVLVHELRAARRTAAAASLQIDFGLRVRLPWPPVPALVPGRRFLRLRR